MKKKRALFMFKVRLSSVFLFLSCFFFSAAVYAKPFIPAFSHRTKIFVPGSKKGDLFDFQLKINIGENEKVPGCHMHLAGKAKPDFSDVRFALADTGTFLPYYLERVTGEKGTLKAEFFVKVKHIPDSGTSLYVYYGNKSARNLSDPEAVFDFYDDFRGPKVDTNKWMVFVELGGRCSLTQDGLLLDAAGVSSKDFIFKDGIIEYSATAETGFETRLIVRDIDPFSETDVNQTAYSSAFKGAEHCIAVGNVVKVNVPSRIAAITRYDYRLIADGQDLTFERYKPGYSKREAAVFYRDLKGPINGHIGLKTSGPGRGRSLTKFHWIRVRKYATIEPRVQTETQGKEELVSQGIPN